MLVASLHEPEGEARDDRLTGELGVRKVLVDASIKRHESAVAERLALPRNRHEQTAGLYTRKVALYDCEIGHELVSRSDEPLMNFCAVEPRNRAALPITLVVTLRG